MMANKAPHDEASHCFLSCDSWKNPPQPHWPSLCSLNTFLSDTLWGHSFTSFEYFQLFSFQRGFSVSSSSSPSSSSFSSFFFFFSFCLQRCSGDDGPQDLIHANLFIFFKIVSSSLHPITLYHPYPLLFYFIVLIIIFCLSLSGM